MSPKHGSVDVAAVQFVGMVGVIRSQVGADAAVADRRHHDDPLAAGIA